MQLEAEPNPDNVTSAAKVTLSPPLVPHGCPPNTPPHLPGLVAFQQATPFPDLVGYSHKSLDGAPTLGVLDFITLEPPQLVHRDGLVSGRHATVLRRKHPWEGKENTEHRLTGLEAASGVF